MPKGYKKNGIKIIPPNRKGVVVSELVRKKMSLAQKGKKMPDSFKEKCRTRMIGKKLSEETKRKMSQSQKGRTCFWKGKKMSEEHRRKVGLANKGSKNNFWKGGITSLYYQIKSLFEYRQWRSDVFTRDNFTCKECNVRGGDLEVHHIKSFALIIRENNIKNVDDAVKCDELWNINNGKTLCISCHKKTKNFGVKLSALIEENDD